MKSNTKTFEVRDLTKVYNIGGGLSRSKVVAVNRASFTLGDRGPEIFTLAGESGSGKTTLARIALGLVEPTSGNIQYDGKEIAYIKGRKQRMAFMREVQPIFQNPFETFNPLKKVYTYLYETGLNYNMAAGKSEMDQVIEDALVAVGLSLEEISGKYPHEFSGGQLQRSSIARALITNPSTLIADEPVSMVDASMRMSIVNLFRELKEKRDVSVMYITHDLATAYYASDRISIMLRGNIVEMGSVEEILDDPLHPYTRLLLESVPEPDTDQKWEKEIALSTFEEVEYAQIGCKFAGRCPHVMETCRKKAPRDIYVDGRLVNCYLYMKK